MGDDQATTPFAFFSEDFRQACAHTPGVSFNPPGLGCELRSQPGEPSTLISMPPAVPGPLLC